MNYFKPSLLSEQLNVTNTKKLLLFIMENILNDSDCLMGSRRGGGNVMIRV